MSKRCFPTKPDALYERYHDEEWGKLNLDSNYLYEMLVLESFQSGLSWATILHKRENFRKDFANWNYEKVAKFTQSDIDQLMNDTGIVRNKMKINAAINNAHALLKLEEKYGSFSEFLNQFISKPIINHPKDFSELPSQDENSQRIAKALKKEGFKFVGPVTIYSFLEAIGLINDHFDWCEWKY